MSLFDFFSGKNEELQKQQEILEDKTREVNSLTAKINSLNERIEKKEEELEHLDYRSKNLQNRINFAACELMNIEAAKDDDVNVLLNENPTKEEMAHALKMYNIMLFRYDLIKSWMGKYEKDLELAKSNLDSFIKERRDEIRSEIIHELYQRASQCETSMLRHLSSFVENADIEDIREQMKIHKHIVKLGLRITTDDSVVSYPTHPIYNMCQDFIQLNIVNIIKEMKYSDWETIKMKVTTLIKDIDHILFTYTETNFDESYLKSVYNYLEAKYLAVQKQEIEKEKQREEREAQKEYERAIKKAQRDEEIALEAIEKKKKELADEKIQGKIIKLQEQISRLEKALQEAKEIRDRAMSMAQQTKSGYVYVISNIGSFGKDVYKIGMTRRLDPMERVMELSNASVPFPFDVHTFIFSNDAPALEAELHRVFDSKKINSINYRKEYFHVTLDEIKEALEVRGVHADFVDEPDAFQYRECQIIKQQNNKFSSIFE
jgi:tetratricopeptide (TPR) repeat protein